VHSFRSPLYLDNRGGFKDPGNRGFGSAGDEKLERCRIPSGLRDRVHKNRPFFVVQALVQSVYDNNRRVYHTLLCELVERFEDKLLQLMRKCRVKDERVALNHGDDPRTCFGYSKSNFVGESGDDRFYIISRGICT